MCVSLFGKVNLFLSLSVFCCTTRQCTSCPLISLIIFILDMSRGVLQLVFPFHCHIRTALCAKIVYELNFPRGKPQTSHSWHGRYNAATKSHQQPAAATQKVFPPQRERHTFVNISKRNLSKNHIRRSFQSIWWFFAE